MELLLHFKRKVVCILKIVIVRYLMCNVRNLVALSDTLKWMLLARFEPRVLCGNGVSCYDTNTALSLRNLLCCAMSIVPYEWHLSLFSLCILNCEEATRFDRCWVTWHAMGWWSPCGLCTNAVHEIWAFLSEKYRSPFSKQSVNLEDFSEAVWAHPHVFLDVSERWASVIPWT